MSTQTIPLVRGDGSFGVEVRGESHYQRALEQVAGKRSTPGEVHTVVKVQAEDGNEHDRNAVRVEIRGRKVGYIPKELAPRVRKAMRARRVYGRVECPAVIRGGGKVGDKSYQFGVWLDLPADFMDEVDEDDGTVASKSGNDGGVWGCLGIGIVIVWLLYNWLSQFFG